MEAKVPRDVLDVDNDDLQPDVLVGTPLVPPPPAWHQWTNSNAIAAAAACSLELSTTAAAYPPQQLATTCSSLPTSSFAHTAPTMGDGGQRATGQWATTGQRAPGQRATTAATSLSALVLHEAHGTGTALGGGLLRDAATCRGSSSHIHAACVGLKAEDEETGAQAPASACTAAQPHAPPGPPPTILPETVEDPKRALVHALQNDLSRMSVLLERLVELLSA